MTPGVYITTSWDDGHPCDLRIAQLLERYGLAGTFYVPREHPEGTIPPSRYATFGPSVELGAHTIHHEALAWIDDARARREIAESKDWIEQHTGTHCPVFCPPRGKFHRRHLDMMVDAGFDGARTVEAWSLDAPRPYANPHRAFHVMPTTVQAYPNVALGNLRNVIKRRSLCGLVRFVRCGFGRDWTHSLVCSLDTAVRRGHGVVHLWGHGWEIAAQKQWPQVDAVFRELSRRVRARQARAVTNGQLVALCRGDADAPPDAPARPVATPPPRPLAHAS